MNNSFTVGVPTYLRGPVLLETLDSILSQCTEEGQVIVVDQTPEYDPDVQGRIDERRSDRRIVWLRQEIANLPMARNVILKMAKTEYVVFVDDDVVLGENFFEEHLRSYEEGIGAVAGNTFQTEKAKDAANVSLRVWSLEQGQSSVDSVIGCNFSVNRNAAIKALGFDEAFEGPAFNEEVDFCKRLRAAGYTIGAAPEARLVHLRPASGGCRVTVPQEEWKKPVGWIIFLYRYKHPWKRRLQIWKNAIAAGPLRQSNRWSVPKVWRSLPSFIQSIKKGRASAKSKIASPF